MDKPEAIRGPSRPGCSEGWRGSSTGSSFTGSCLSTHFYRASACLAAEVANSRQSQRAPCVRDLRILHESLLFRSLASNWHCCVCTGTPPDLVLDPSYDCRVQSPDGTRRNRVQHSCRRSQCTCGRVSPGLPPRLKPHDGIPPCHANHAQSSYHQRSFWRIRFDRQAVRCHLARIATVL
jgi:hypothetical protein